MRITRKEKLLLALMLAGSISLAGTSAVRADDDDENKKDYTEQISENLTLNDYTSGTTGNYGTAGTVTTTVTVNAPEVVEESTGSTEPGDTGSGSGEESSSETQYSHEYTDANGNSYKIDYTAGTTTTEDETTTTTGGTYTFTVTTTDESSNTTTKTYTYTASGTSSVTADGITTTTTTAASFSYDDGSGTKTTYTYIPGATISTPTVSIAGTGTDASGNPTTTTYLTYGTPTAGTTTTAAYYAWTTDGFVRLTQSGNSYTYTDSQGTEQTVEAPDITVNYTGTWGTTTGNGSDYTNGSATNNSGNGNAGLVINSVTSTSTGNVEQSINANFIGNTATPSSQGVVAVVVNLNTSGNNTTSTTNYTASITSIAGNFIGNTNTSTNTQHTSANGGVILNQVGMETPSTIGGAATIGTITGSFIGNSAQNTVSYEVEQGGEITTNPVDTAQQGPEYMARGGAIENNLYNPYDETSSATIGTITGDFIGNYAYSLWGDAQGGAIFNYASIHTEDASESDLSASASIGTTGGINGNFINNYVYGASYANGGAIYNTADGYCMAIIGGTTTTADGEVTTVYGITGDFIGNYAYSTETEASGGAIFNVAENAATAQIVSITGSFIGNTASVDTETGTNNTDGAQGGAIFNTTQYGTAVIGVENATVSDTNPNGEFRLDTEAIAIQGDFIGNSVVAGSGDAAGGAIANWVDNSNTGDATVEMESAAIGNITASQVTIDADGNQTGGYGFMYNSAIATAGEASGGAIENRSQGTYGIAEIEHITANFVGNYASATGGNAYGGAIQNRSDNADSTTNIASIESITGDFIGNYAVASGTTGNDDYGNPIYASAFGGAINNYLLADAENLSAIIGTVSGNFIGNYVEAEGYARGGAISNGYDQTSIGNSLIASIENSTFIGNSATAGDSNGSYGGAIYNTGTIGGTAEYTEVYVYHFYTTVEGDVGPDGQPTTTTVTTRFVEEVTEDATTGEKTRTGTYYAVDDDGVRTGAYIVASSTTEGSYDYYESSAANNPSGTFDANGNYTVATGGTQLEEGTTITGELTHHFEVGVTTAVADEQTGKYSKGILNTVFMANEATRGGAIYNGSEKVPAGTELDDGSTVTSDSFSIISSIDGCYFVSNVADKFGGAIYNYDDGQILSITNSIFDSNLALDGNGGAIENAEAGSYIGNISGNYFYNNQVTTEDHGGGALYNEGIIEKFVGNVFEKNTSGNFGGAFYNNGGTISSITGDAITTDTTEDDTTGETVITISYTSAFIENEADRGGAIYNTATRTLTDGVESINLESTGSIESIENTYFYKNVADYYGGAIYNYHGGEIGNIQDNYFIENVAKNGNGGAIENAETDAIISNITGNIFYKNDVSESEHGGGAIYNQGIIESITGGNYFVENTSGNFGGAIYNNGGLFGGEDDLSTEPGTETDEIEGSISGNYFYGNSSGRGGAIYNTITRTLVNVISVDSVTQEATEEDVLNLDGNGTIKNINNNTFAYNTSTHMGGAIYNYHGAEIGSISGNTFTSNEAQDGNGGAVENAEFDATIGDMVSNTFSGNTASGNGGAIYNQGTIGIQRGTSETDPDQVTGGISESTFQGNTAANGGAIYNNIGTDTVYILASNNSSEETITIVGDNGTEYQVSSRTIEGAGAIGDIAGNNFVSNQALGHIASTSTNSDGTTIYTYAGDAKGGAIYNASGTVTGGDTVYISTINSITSYVDSSTGNTTYSVFVGNSASATGTTYTDDNEQSVTENGDAAGGAIYNAGTIGEITITGSVSLTVVDANGNTSNQDFSGFTSNSASTTTASGSAQGGAIYNSGTIGTVTETEVDGVATTTVTGITTAVLSSNTATSENGAAAGGAIYNSESGKIEMIEVTSGITGNTATGATSAAGGAIYNAGSLDSIAITGDVYYNVATAGTGDAQGGAIYSKDALTISAVSLTINNATSSSGSAAGGAIFIMDNDNDDKATGSISVTGDVSSNTAKGDGGEAGGGAIYNGNEYVTISVTGDVTYNTATAGAGDAQGGAIYTIGTTEIKGAVAYNSVDATEEALGGAIYSEGTLTVTASSITGNTATSKAGDASGGAIYVDNSGAGSSITVSGAVSGNSAKTTGTADDDDAFGGAIYSEGELTVNATTITNNTATSESGDAAGGAIFNIGGGTITVTGSIMNNTATASNGEAIGGAIYTTGDVNVTADSTTISISGNKANDDENAIYMAAAEDAVSGGKLTFNLSGGSSIYLYDNIQGEGNYDVVISGSGTDDTFYLFNDVNAVSDASDASPTSIKPYADEFELATTNNADLSIGNVTLSTIDASLYNTDELEKAIHVYNVNSFTVTGDFDMAADVDLASETMDRFVTNGNNYSTAGGTLNVSYMNLISDTEKDSAAVYFAETGLMTDVTAGGSGSYHLTAYTPIYSYDVYYLYSDKGIIYYDGEEVGTAADSDLISEDGGYFAFAKSGVDDPWTKTEDEDLKTDDDDDDENKPNTDTDDDDDDDDNDDDYNDDDKDKDKDKDKDDKGTGGGDKDLGNYNPAVLAPEVAIAGAYNAMNLMFEYNFEHSDYYMKLPEAVRIAQKEEEPQESDATKAAYYNQHELTYTGAWTRAFTSNESVDYQDGFSSRDKYYGAMFGFDTKVHEHDNGWASVFTGYVGTMGIRQTYSGGHIKQHGGFIGATASFYKKNFYTAWTIAGGSMKAHEHTMYGKDKERLDTYGVAARIGYNIKLGDEGKFSLLPTFTASYTYVNPEDFTNAAGVQFDSKGFSAVQLNPNIKLIWNRDDGWYPYLTVGEVWTVGESCHVNATWSGQRHSLIPLELDNYTEYGVGVQKRWANERDAYVQVLGHSHGRDGILVNAGVRFNF